MRNRIKTALPTLAALLGLAAGITDSVHVVTNSPQYFNGLVDQVAYVIFGIGIYSVAGLAFGVFAALFPPKFFLIRDELDETGLRRFYFSLLVGVTVGLLVIVESVNFFFFTADLLENGAVVLGAMVGSYLLIPLVQRLLSRISAVNHLLGRIEMMFRNKVALCVFAAVFMLSASNVILIGAFASNTSGVPKPNIILISLDTLGADHMSCYGYPRPTTPNIDRFAEEAVQFMEHFSVSRSTLPSHMSILTSLYPSVHKVIDSFSSVLDDRFVTLTEVLKEHGYETGAFVDGNRELNIGAVHGFDQGFDFYEHYPDRFLKHEKLYIVKRLYNFLANMLHANGIYDMHSEEIFSGALSWIAQHERDHPFFLFLHTYDIHSDFATNMPYVAPPEFSDLAYKAYKGDFTGCSDRGICASDYLGKINRWIRRGTYEPDELLSPEDVKLISSWYDCGIKYTDHEFGVFYDKLRENDLLDNSIVVLTSDHGEQFFQHHQTKHNQYYDEIIQVPLLIRYPQKLQAGTKVSKLTRSIDILPTILELAEIQTDVKQFQGVSLSPFMTAVNGLSDKDGLQLFGGEDRPIDFDTKIMRTLNYKYIANGRQRRASSFYEGRPEELYDVVNDPGEQNNVIHSEREVYLNLLDQVKQWKIECDKLRSIIVPDKVTKKIKINDKAKKELESLGYIK
ncbi:sulfatase [candidate division KSB1 bacterium]|nr:sulfatase [candidate division KSB1 bacterium]NIR72208.1 sulfatase [candidate division KSB1 bacterium]NIS26673.1 sulfatase [candidate division KSB1 bacterium]NIT73441.1 sulfatase [candidate division KSB1 bacterium]NIU27289.1 sulfatase [candidate division KSB1 bacterium]